MHKTGNFNADGGLVDSLYLNILKILIWESDKNYSEI